MADWDRPGQDYNAEKYAWMEMRDRALATDSDESRRYRNIVESLWREMKAIKHAFDHGSDDEVSARQFELKAQVVAVNMRMAIDARAERVMREREVA